MNTCIKIILIIFLAFMAFNNAEQKFDYIQLLIGIAATLFVNQPDKFKKQNNQDIKKMPNDKNIELD